MRSLPPADRLAYELLINQKLPAAEVSQRLASQGIKMSPQALYHFKKNVFGRLMTIEKRERMLERMLESVERVKFEFEEVVKETKRVSKKADKAGNLDLKLASLRDRMIQITTAMKFMGFLNTSMINLKAQNINILNPSDLSEAFKRMQASWFGKMNASLERGKIILNEPTPELIDDFNRWRAKQLREAEKVGNGRADS